MSDKTCRLPVETLASGWRRVWLALCALTGLLALPEAAAQLGVELSFDRQYYLKYEPVAATVRLRNYTGNRLTFDPGALQAGARLSFEIQTQTGADVDPINGALNPVAGLSLEAGETKELQLVLNNFFNLQTDGSYSINARLSHPRLGQDYRSAAAFLEIQEGITEWERTVGVPSADDRENIKPRTVSLLLLRERVGDTYCLRIEDSAMVYGVMRLGPRWGGAELECDVDALSHLHLLYQSMPRLYAYRIYDIDGNLLQEKYFIVEKTIPHLYRNPSLGSIKVTGGRPADAGADYQQRGSGRPPTEGLLQRPE